MFSLLSVMVQDSCIDEKLKPFGLSWFGLNKLGEAIMFKFVSNPFAWLLMSSI